MAEPDAETPGNRLADAASVLIIALSSGLDVVVLLLFRPSSEWALILVLLAFASAFAIDWAVTSSGAYVRLSKVALYSLIGAHAMVTFLVSLWLGLILDDAILWAFAALILVGFLSGLETAYLPARKVLRTFRGLRSIGDFRIGAVSAVVPQSILDGYGTEFVEDRVKQELVGTLEPDENATFTERGDSGLGFNIARIGNVKIVHRVDDRLVEVLYIPEDGVVVRFEDAEKPARQLSFILEHVLHFEKPDPAELKGINKDLEQVYQKFAEPVLDLRTLGKSLTGIWRVRRRVIVVLIAAPVTIVLGVVAALNTEAIVAWLSEPRTNSALASLVYITAIVAFTVGVLRWLSSGIRG